MLRVDDSRSANLDGRRILCKLTEHDFPFVQFLEVIEFGFLTTSEAEYLRNGETIHGALLHTLCELFLPEDRVLAFIDLAVAAAAWNEEMAIARRPGPQARHDALERVFDGFRDALARLRAASAELFGAEAWTQIQTLFTYAETSVASTKAVEGG